ncbi:MAG: hypothetical protein AAF125_12010 [Chloroflexota bacterium]
MDTEKERQDHLPVIWQLPDRLILGCAPPVIDDAFAIYANKLVVDALNSAKTFQVVVMIDCANMTQVKLSPSVILRSQSYLKHPRLGAFIAYNVPMQRLLYVESVFRLFSKIARRHYHVTADEISALAYLRQHDLLGEDELLGGLTASACT